MKKILCMMAVMVLFAVVLSGCTGGSGGGDLVGRWDMIGYEYEGEFEAVGDWGAMQLVFNSDGTGYSADGGEDAFLWETSGRVLRMELDDTDGFVLDFTYDITGNQLRLAFESMWGEGEETMVFERVQ